MSENALCAQTRLNIDRGTAWMAGLIAAPGLNDPGRDEFESDVDEVLKAIKDAYNTRPVGCSMEMSGEYDEFDCVMCGFARVVVIGN